MKITIFIPTLNPDQDFPKILEKIHEQTEQDFEILIIDSDSSIDVQTHLKPYPNVKFLKIKKADFGHAKTRNLAVQISESKFMVFLSQDAVPQDENWLKELVEPLEKEEQIIACFSRQIPNEQAGTLERVFYQNYFANQVKRQYGDSDVDNYFFSNVSSCIRRETLLKNPFDEKIHFSEDRKFVLDVLNKNNLALYNPNSTVIHSHNYNFKKNIKRYFDSTVSLQMIFGNNFKKFLKSGSNYMKKEFIFILKNKPQFLPNLIINNLAKIIGTLLGMNWKILPKSLVKKLTSTPHFFDTTVLSQEEIEK